MNRYKIFTSILLLILTSHLVFAQKGIKNPKYFLLQKSVKVLSVNSFKNGDIQEKLTYTINKNSIYSTDGNERIAILDTTSNKLRVYNLKTNKETKKDIPHKIKPKSIFINTHNIFIGGDEGKEILLQFHIQSEDWFSLEIPSLIMKWGKSIDDFVITEKYLIAIDNLIMPKFILFYKLNPSKKLKYSHLMELKSNGTYESIFFGRITEKYMALNSGTFGGYGTSEHIAVYKKNNLRKSFSISSDKGDSDYHSFNDFIIVGDKLIMASKKRGLGFCKIEERYFKESDSYGNTDFNENIGTSEIKYQSHKGKNITKLTIIPHSTKIILSIKKRSGKIIHEIIEI